MSQFASVRPGGAGGMPGLEQFASRPMGGGSQFASQQGGAQFQSQGPGMGPPPNQFASNRGIPSQKPPMDNLNSTFRVQGAGGSINESDSSMSFPSLQIPWGLEAARAGSVCAGSGAVPEANELISVRA